MCQHSWLTTRHFKEPCLAVTTDFFFVFCSLKQNMAFNMKALKFLDCGEEWDYKVHHSPPYPSQFEKRKWWKALDSISPWVPDNSLHVFSALIFKTFRMYYFEKKQDFFSKGIFNMWGEWLAPHNHLVVIRWVSLAKYCVMPSIPLLLSATSGKLQFSHGLIVFVSKHGFSNMFLFCH